MTVARRGRAGQVRTVALRVTALALLLLLALMGALATRTLNRLPDTTLYLVRDEGTAMTLEPVHRRLGATDPAAAARRAVEALALGPTAEEVARGLSSELPVGTRVRDVRLDAGTLMVDLSSEVVMGGGSASMIGRLAQLQYTLTQSSAVEAVEVRVDGVLLEAWGGEGVMTAWPWRRSGGALPRW